MGLHGACSMLLIDRVCRLSQCSNLSHEIFRNVFVIFNLILILAIALGMLTNLCADSLFVVVESK